MATPTETAIDEVPAASRPTTSPAPSSDSPPFSYHREEAEGPDECPTCSWTIAAPIYAVGALGVTFPSLALQREYEFERAALPKGGRTESENLHQVLSSHPNLARAMCWTLRIQGIDAYHLVPRSQLELDDLVEVLKPDPEGHQDPMLVAIGHKGPIKDQAGLALPVVMLETSYAFSEAALLRMMASSLGLEKSQVDDFLSRSREALGHVRQITDNFGETDGHRALNYCAVRFAPLYQTVADAMSRDHVLTSIEARPSRLSAGAQRVVDVLVTLEPRKVGAPERYFVRVNVSDLYPYVLTTAMQPFFDR